MVGALVPDASALPNAPCPALLRPTTAGTVLRICWTVWTPVCSIAWRPMLIRFDPTGATPRMLVPVTTIASVGALVCAAAPGAAVCAASTALLDCSGALSPAVAGRTWLDVGDAFGMGG